MIRNFVRLTWISMVCCLGVVFVGSPALRGEESGWSWNPFQTTTTTTSAATTPEPKKWIPEWKMPDVAGSMKKASQSVTKSTTSAWQATTRTTKNAWKKTTEALDPFPEPKTSAPGGPWATPSTPAAKTKSKGFFGWFSASKPVDDRPSTVQDFLRQERLQ